jgi:hypothetical protein
LFGLFVVFFGFSASTILLLPHKNGSRILLNYFAQPNYWMAFVLIIVACTFVGYISIEGSVGIGSGLTVQNDR